MDFNFQGEELKKQETKKIKIKTERSTSTIVFFFLGFFHLRVGFCLFHELAFFFFFENFP